MASAKATEFLTKQLSIEKETVTFRWLSRKLSVHVNVAKNELALFHASSRSTDVSVHATYLLTGEVAPVNSSGSYRDNDDDEVDVEDGMQESVATRKIILVGEDGLEDAKAQFTQTPSVHIYSLSPVTIRDAALLAPMADRVRLDDVSKGRAYNQTIGIVVGPDVKIGQAGKSSTSKLPNTRASASSSKLNQPIAIKKPAEKPRSSEKGDAPEKSKRGEKKMGTLDWSKAKPKWEKDTEATTAKSTKEVVKKESKSGLKGKNEPVQPDASKVKEQHPMEAKTNTKHVVESEKPKRGTKRPSAIMSLSDSEDNNPSPKTKPRVSASPAPKPSSQANGVKVKKGVLLSDEDEQSPQKVKLKTVTKPKTKGRVSVAQPEEEEEEEEEEAGPCVKAMTDLDDPQVSCCNTQVQAASNHEEDVEILSDDEPIPPLPKAKRKPKKAIPVGRNGLPKKRVVKSRKSMNAKGYTITEDYSSYESASESEQIQSSDKRKKAKKSKQKQMDDSGTTKLKGSTKPEDNRSAKTAAGKFQTRESNVQSKKLVFGSGEEGSTSKPAAKVSDGGKNGGKSNLMSYFAKK